MQEKYTIRALKGFETYFIRLQNLNFGDRLEVPNELNFYIRNYINEGKDPIFNKLVNEAIKITTDTYPKFLKDYDKLKADLQTIITDYLQLIEHIEAISEHEKEVKKLIKDSNKFKNLYFGF